MKKYKPRDPNKTDLENDELSGPVKQVMETTYKAHLKANTVIRGKIETERLVSESNYIRTYNEKGRRTEEQFFGTNGREVKKFDNKGLEIETKKYNKAGNLEQTTTITYDDKGDLLLYLVTGADGSFKSKQVHTYRDDRKPLEQFSYHGSEEKIYDRREFTYDDKGNMTSSIAYDSNGNITYQMHKKYNAQGKETEYVTQHMEARMKDYNSRTLYKYNEHGDCVSAVIYTLGGVLKNTYTYTPEYDSEGKRIIPVYPDETVSGETETTENDAHGNWIQKTIFYNKIPVNTYIREIAYFDDVPAKAPFTHPLTMASADEVEDTSNQLKTELSDADAQWLAEAPNAVPEVFSAYRHYIHFFKMIPSVLTYTGPYIEVYELLDELKENMMAQEIHSYNTVWHGQNDRLVHYTLKLHQWGYLLHVINIGAHNSSEFEIPDFMEDNGTVYFSQVQLLRPSEASGDRDEYFEDELYEYIHKCSLRKKPEKPVINMIEVKGNSFTMVEHAVDDNFEIKDLDVNYGYGFEKFHDELMQRFITDTKGLVLFHGQPGTGKTYYIRHLLRKMAAGKKVVIYMPPNMVDHLVEPGFMTFLTGEVKDWSSDGNFCVLLIEDAEPLLAKRQEGVRIQGVTNLLNMTDGLLNDMLNLQIICTFNVDLKKLDSALLRPGRLIARKEFKALGELDANLLAQRLGIKYHFTAPATLGEIYAMRKNKNTLIHDVETDKDSSTLLDDLL